MEVTSVYDKLFAPNKVSLASKLLWGHSSNWNPRADHVKMQVYVVKSSLWPHGFYTVSGDNMILYFFNSFTIYRFSKNVNKQLKSADFSPKIWKFGPVNKTKVV